MRLIIEDEGWTFMDLKKYLHEIDQLKAKLDTKRPLPNEVVRNLRQHLLVEWTYHSNSIEGNTLTLSETKVVIEDGITIGGKSIREHLEAINHKEAIIYLEEMVANKEPLSEQTIKNIHSIILRGIDTKNAGVYRKSKVLISGAEHIPPSPFVLEDDMKQLMTWYNGEARNIHPVKRAALLHTFFVKIHPFIDGNGRTARLLLNLELMKSGYLPIVIKTEQRLDYYKTLDQSHTKDDHNNFISLVAENVKKTFNFYIDFLDID